MENKDNKKNYQILHEIALGRPGPCKRSRIILGDPKNFLK
jgi:hypothetical protein